jgi:hypothetical protein
MLGAVTTKDVKKSRGDDYMDNNTALIKSESTAFAIIPNALKEPGKVKVQAQGLENAQEQILESAVYLAEDVQKALSLGKTKTYEFLRQVYITQQPFRVIKIGRVFRIPKYSFDRWLYSDSGEVS